MHMSEKLSFFSRLRIYTAVFSIPALYMAGEQCANADQLSSYAVPVSVISVATTTYSPPVVLSGAIAARSLINVSFRLNGQVIERKAEVGQHVETGQSLALIDNVEQQANLRVAEASKDAAQAQLVQTQANFKRQKALLAQGFTTRSTFDQANQNLETAKSTLASAQSELKDALEQLSYTTLQAPVTGVITDRSIESGQVVQAAQTAFSIAEDGMRDAVFDVQETLVNHAKPGMSVTLTLLSDASVTAEGQIREISPVVDSSTGTVRVKVGLARTPPQMALGATVTGTIHMMGAKVVVLPWSSMTSDGGRPAVWRIARESKVATLVPIKILAYEKERLIVESGLQEGELIVTKGSQMLRTGERTEVILEHEGLVVQ